MLPPVANPAVDYPGKSVVVAERDLQRADRITRLTFPFGLDDSPHARIKRQENRNSVPELHQLAGQRTYDVSQPAGLGERSGLRGGKCNLHRACSGDKNQGPVYYAASARDSIHTRSDALKTAP